jgi:hypothetical protein
MLEFVSRLVDLALVYMGRNVRLPKNLKIQELADDIAENGLLTPISAFEVKGRGFEVIQGHRRALALKSLYDSNKARFKELFPKGIPISLIQGITYEEAQAMKVDHGNIVALVDPMELQLCANLLLSQGKGEKEVVTKLASLMDRIKPMKSDKLKKYQQMLSDAQLWREKKNEKEAEAKMAEAIKFLFDYRRGMVQNLNNAYRCPNVVMAALWLKATGENPPKESDFYTESPLPKGLTYQHVSSLWNAFQKDLTHTNPDGSLKYNKRVPGPDFNAKWAEILKDLEPKAEGEEAPRNKAFSQKELEEATRKWVSKGFQILTKHYRRETVDLGALQALDKVAYFAEILSEKAPTEWAEAIKLAEGIEKLNAEAVKQAAEAQPKPKKANRK